VFLTAPVRVGVENRLYGNGVGAVWREKSFGLLEDQWPRLRTELIQSGHLHGNDRQLACMFLALQIARTREHVAQATFPAELADFTHEIPPSRDTVLAFIRERHRHEPADAEVEAAWTLDAVAIKEGEPPPSFDEMFPMSMDVATTKLAPLLDQRHWRVEATDQPVLWKCDRPVMPWRPPSPRDAFEGVGYGDSEEVRVLLSSVAMLVLSKKASRSPVRIATSRFHDFNADIALQRFEFIDCAPGRRARLEHVSLTANRPAVRFNLAPGVEVTRGGTEIPIGDVIHTWIPLRAVEGY
jgi:hypothetical protein